MKFQDSNFNGLKVTVGTKSVTHARTHPCSKSNMPHQLIQSWGHKHSVNISQYKPFMTLASSCVSEFESGHL